MSGEVAQWLSVDPRTNRNTPYDSVSALQLEAAHRSGKPEVVLVLGGNKFVVKLSEMRQYNTAGLSRRVLRLSNRPVAPLEPVELTPDLVDAASRTVATADEAVRQLEADEAAPTTSVTSKSFGDPEPVIRVFDAIIAQFAQPRYKEKYGFNEEADAALLRARFGHPVPSYFANIEDGQSIYRRKLLSILGLRNLVKYGPEIFLEMRQQLFSSNPNDYKGQTGPSKMRHYTGNAVDLDTCVLRCHDRTVLEAVNLIQEKDGNPKFASGEELAKSEVGRRMAVQSAKVAIDAFRGMLKLDDAQCRRRNIDIDVDDLVIAVSTESADRGKSPVWMYRNEHVLTFHANVPTLSDVYGALLRAPYHLVKAFVLCDATKKQEALDEFFEDGVSDSCFNAKWKSIEALVQKLEDADLIDAVLNRLQEQHQAEFLALGDDEDGAKELALMQRLASGVSGVDPKTRQSRGITQDDVAAWHKRVMAC